MLAAPPVHRLACVVALFSVTGCSVGGGGAATPSTTDAGSLRSAANVAVALSIPGTPSSVSTSSAGARKPKFVSPATMGISISSYVSPGATQNPGSPAFTAVADVSSTSSACTANASGGRTCTISATAPPGSADFVVKTYDVTPSQPGFLTASHLLGQATISGTNILSNQTNTVNVALGGVPAKVQIAAPITTFNLLSAATFAVAVTALDAQNNVIIAGGQTASNGGSSQTDTYANPVTVSLTETGATGRAKLSLNGGAPTTSVTSTKSSDVVTFSYDGAAAAGTNYSVNLSASANGATTATTFVAGFSLSGGTSPSGATFTNGAGPTLAFTSPSVTQSISVTESGSPNYSAALANGGSTNCPTGAITLNASSIKTTLAFGVTSGTTVNTVGTGCIVNVSDGLGTTIALAVTTKLTGNGQFGLGVPGSILYVPATSTSNSSEGPPLNLPLGSCGNALANAGVLYRFQIGTGGTTSGNFAGANTKLTCPIAVAHDNVSTGTIWVLDSYNSLLGFDATQGGNVAPLLTIPGSDVGFVRAVAIAVDGSGRIYLADANANRIFVLRGCSVQPCTLISAETTLSTVNLGFTPTAIALDSGGNMYVASSGQTASMYAPPSSGTSTPAALRTLTLPANPGGEIVSGIAVDTSGNVFLATAPANGGAASSNGREVYEYAAGGSTTVPVVTMIANSASGLSGVAVANGQAYIGLTIADGGSSGGGIMVLVVPSYTCNCTQPTPLSPVLSTRGPLSLISF